MLIWNKRIAAFLGLSYPTMEVGHTLQHTFFPSKSQAPILILRRQYNHNPRGWKCNVRSGCCEDPTRSIQEHPLCPLVTLETTFAHRSAGLEDFSSSGGGAPGSPLPPPPKTGRRVFWLLPNSQLVDPAPSGVLNARDG